MQKIANEGIDYKIIRYPDGQISIKIDTFYAHAKLVYRVNSYEDLFIIKSIVEAVRSEYPDAHISLVIPCLFGQRSDKRFSKLQSFDLKVIADMINSCNFSSVKIFDPHSDVALALINNSEKLSSLKYVSDVITELYKPEYGINNYNFTLVSPDGGAYKKLFEYGEKLSQPVVAANKHRDLQGNISLTFAGDVKDKHCLIVDDLLDGGYTFVKLAEELKKNGAQKVYLYVSHGYFSKRLDELRKNIDHIFCTNSVKDLPDAWHDGTKTIPVSDFVTQFKVF